MWGEQYGGPGTWPYGGPAQPNGPATNGAEPSMSPLPVKKGGRRRRLAVVAVIAALAVGVAGTAVVLSQSSAKPAAASTPARSGTPTPSPTDSTPDTSSQAAATLAILDRRAAALHKGDLAAWLADVDPDQPALVAHQKMLFTNLRKLPLSQFRWVALGGIAVDFPVPASVTAKLTDEQAVYGSSVDLQYALRGYDAFAVDDDYSPIFLERGGRWLLAGDLTQSREADDAWVEPWDTEPIVVGTGKHSLVVLSASDAKKLKATVAQADAALGKVAAMWPVGTHRAVFYDTRNRQVFATYLGGSLGTDDYAGVTRALRDVSIGPGPDDLRVVLNPKYAPPGSSQVPALMRHEFTHVAKWNDQGDGTPKWAIEGIAEYTAFRDRPSDARIDDKIAVDASKGHLPKTLPSSDSFFASDASSSYDYGIAWCTFEFISERYKETKVRALYEALAKIDSPRDSPAATAAEAHAFKSVLGMSEASFVKKLNAWIKLVIRNAPGG
jgi:hypothetical protein